MKSHQQRLQAWQDAAASCGLQVITSDTKQPKLEALAGVLWVRIEPCGDRGQSTRVAIVAPGSPDFIVVRIRPESTVPFEGEIEVGDESFDKVFAIAGPTPTVLALLDAETRRLLLRLRTETLLEVSLGGLRAESDSEDKILALLPLLLDAGKRFAQPPDIAQRLAENVRHDPEPRVRLQNLLFLIRDDLDEPGTVEALRVACSDSSPEIRLRAAKELGAEAHGILLEVAETLIEDDTLCAETVSALGRELPLELAKTILDRALDLRHLQTAHACIGALRRRGGDAAVDLLARVFAREEGELATAAVQALVEIGSPAGEPTLILALRSEQEDLRMSAASALGRVGSTAAVLPLKEAAQRSWLDRDLRRAVRHAIAEIQSRLSGASPGQLSLAGAEAGQLSLPETEAGQLSLATDPAGELSISDTADPAGKD